MNSPHSQKFWNLIGRAVFSSVMLASLAHRAVAAEPPIPAPFTPPIPAPFAPPSPLTPESARAFLKVDLAQRVCQRTMSLSVQNATLDDIAARVQKLIAASNATSKLRVQVRNALPIRLSFATKTSTVSEVLSSAATLAGAQLWIFSDHLLLAPKDALLPDELEALKKGSVIEVRGQLGQSYTGDSGLRERWQQAAFSTFIADEIKGLSAAMTNDVQPPGGTQGPTVATTPPSSRSSEKKVASTTLGQLSPDAQAMLGELFGQSKSMFMRSSNPGFPNLISQMALSSDNPVTLLAGRRDSVRISISGAQGIGVDLDWSLDGGGSSAGTSSTDPSKPAPQISPVGDPSAGQS